MPPDELRVMELQAVAGEPVLDRLLVGRDLTAALHLVRSDGTVASGAAAVIGAARRMRGLGVLAAVYDNPLGHALWEAAYRLVARNRHRIGRALGNPAVCATMPT